MYDPDAFFHEDILTREEFIGSRNFVQTDQSQKESGSTENDTEQETCSPKCGDICSTDDQLAGS